ncbi:hypothetical protein WN943_024172 [Citrus x changshan-huyou]
MRWDNKVAAYAQNYANQRKADCRLVHSGGPYGENLAWSSGDLTGTAAVKLWVDERPKYNYNSNTCVGGECRHYTQVVWHNSVRLGCARVKCNNNRGTFVICSYDPPGNVAALATIHLSSAHNKPEDYLKAHNEARASVGVGPMSWDYKLADYSHKHAQKLKGNCNLKKPQVSKYSETIAWSSQGEITAAEFVKMCMDGKPLYDYNSNTCALNGTKCAIYTQVVWRNSVRLGCAKERCNNNGTLNFVICNYDPRGNVFGQRPY